MKRHMSQALSPVNISSSSRQTGRCAASRNNRRNTTRATAGHRCNNSTAVGKSAAKERSNNGAPSVGQDLIPSGSVVNTTDTRKGCSSGTINSVDKAKKDMSSIDSVPPKLTRKRVKQRRSDKTSPHASTTSDTSPHPTKLKLTGSKRRGKWSEGGEYGKNLTNGDCLSSAMEDSGRGNELSSSESDHQVGNDKFCGKKSGVQSCCSTCFSDSDEDLFEDALSNFPSENEKSNSSTPSSAFFTPLSTRSQSPLLPLAPQTGSESGHLANSVFVHSLTNSLQEIAVKQAVENCSKKDSSDNVPNVLSDAPDLLKKNVVIDGCAGNGSDGNSRAANLLNSGTKASRSSGSGAHPKARKGGRGCDSPASTRNLAMTERRAQGGKHRNKGVFGDQRHVANSYVASKFKSHRVFIPQVKMNPKPIPLTVGVDSASSSASPASSVCSSPPTLSPSPTSSFHLPVEIPVSQPAPRQLVLENIANRDHIAKSEGAHQDEVKDEWPDFGVASSAKPSKATLYASGKKDHEPKRGDLPSVPPIAVTPTMPGAPTKELDGSCNFSVNSSNESVSHSLARQNEPASILLARQPLHESCSFVPMCNEFQSVAHHQLHLSPDQYLQYQSHQLNIFVKQHQEQQEKKTDNHIFFSFDPPPSLLNVSPTGHLPLAPLQMVPSPPTIPRPLIFSPPPVHIHPIRPDIRTRLPCHTYSCPPPPPPLLLYNIAAPSAPRVGGKAEVEVHLSNLLEESRPHAEDADRSLSEESRPRAEDTEHPLSDTWVMWFDKTTGTQRNPCSNYRASLSEVSSISSIELFWQVYNNIPSPKDMDQNSNLHYFKKGIQPLWEDPANQEGGKWVLTIKGDANGLSKCWMEVLLLLIGGGVEKGHLINGTVMSRRKKGDRIALWTSTRNEDSNLDICTDLMRAVLLAYDVPSEEMGSFMTQLSEGKHGRSLVFMYHSDALVSGHSYQNSVHIRMADHIDVILQELKRLH